MLHKKYVYWLFLIVAVLFEVLASASMKLGHISSSSISTEQGLILTYILIGISYFFLAKAVRAIPVTIAYAFWEGLGLVLISVVSFTFLGETLTWLKFLGLVSIMAGVYLVEKGVHK